MKSTTPKKGDDKYKKYIKWQYNYKKKHFTRIQFELRTEADSEIIEALKNYNGNRTELFRQILAEKLLNK